tara:strand:+ start:67 stop:693 length:627 start_codon:yes stop_codon:yes gene_type:complete
MEEYAKKVYPINDCFILNYSGVTLPGNFDSYIHKSISKSDKFILGAFGILRPIKGHDILIKAAAKLIKDGFDIEVRIFGSGVEKNNLEKLAVEENIGSRLYIYDYVDDIDKEMRECHIVVHPSRFESFGYVPVEAMSLGVPSITSDVGGPKEIMTGDLREMCFKNNDADSLVNRLKFVIEKGSFVKFEEVKKFSESRFIKKALEIYSQ